MPAPYLREIRVGFLSSDVEDKRRAHNQLLALHHRDHRAFIEACRRLIQDVEASVARAGLWMLAQFGDRDDAETEAMLLEMRSVPELHGVLLHALGTVGTEAIVPLLFAEAVKDPCRALAPLARQVRSDSDKQRALMLARDALLLPVYRSRDAALRALRTLSSAEAEEELLLAAYRAYHDELVARALGGATPRMLPVLEELAASIDSKYAEHHDLLHAIKRLKTRMVYGDEADPGHRNFFLKDYL
jgi:hypothetical protein